MDNYNRFTNIQLDALKEVGNIGAAHAATALSQILNKTIMISVTQVKVMPIEQIVEVVGGGEVETTVVGMRILGDVIGVIVLALRKEDAASFLNTLQNKGSTLDIQLKEFEQAALKEAGSILSAAYLKAIGNLLNFSLIPSTAKVISGKMNDILQEILKELARRVEIAFCIETEFVESASKINGHFLLIPEIKSLDSMFKALGI